MYPVLIRLGPITVHTYGFMLALGVVLGLWFVARQARREQLPGGRLVDMAFYTIIVALLGAKLVLFLGNVSYYWRYPSELLTLARSGGVFQGGLFFGLIFAIWFLHRHRLPTWKVADIAGPAIALGHGFGRLGCFSAGCCYGRACDVPWGVMFGSEYAHSITGVPLHQVIHPTQLYESILNFTNFFLLYLVLRKKRFDGQVFSLYIINYSIIRFFVEFYRGDHPESAYLIHGASPYLSLNYFQVFCLVGLAFGLVLYFIRKRKTT
ncbi:prolipoprotein diacylglyceryl transferase [Candidatus Aminicenantes bacterium AC-334-K16]|jgi:phosphatidylglycerol:prolipoprotein diacylglycerol transferase|nr:prolipoprotein diacylglyceryl transferase [Candidatus Aminicenantes bacterium AC-334-K16]